MIKYSKIRKLLDIQPLKDVDNKQANVTHYLHNKDNGVAHYFEESASEYLINHKNIQQSKIFNWDIPYPTPKNPTFKFIDLFAGIGGLRIAYQNNGGKCVFSSEWNKFSKVTYEANFGEVPFGDITKYNENKIPEHDILIGGFPCQPFSLAGVSKKNSLGKKHGFLDETQGTLFFDIARIIKAKKPKAFMLENVKNLVSHDKKRTFKVIHETLEKLGYSIHFKVLDGKYYVPQHRERIIIVGFDKEIFEEKEDFKFPVPTQEIRKFRDILEPNPDEKYTLSDKLWNYLQNYAAKHRAKGNGFGFGMTNFDGISRTLSARYYKDGSEVLIPQEGKNPRRLTPRECARLQGFSEKFIIPVSDNQAYQQFGNSVVVPLMQAVSEQVVKVLMTKK